MVYCMSDLHGEYDRYIKMLNLIEFADNDRLFILGDCIDRGKRGIDILLDVMNRSNVTMLLGNHEAMILDGIRTGSYRGGWNLWKHNGGKWTRNDYLYKRSPEERERIVKFLENSPDHANLELGGRKFHLVHGYPSDNREDRLWLRPEPDVTEPISGVVTIVGHTPTVYYNGNDDKAYYIWHGNGVICIDCGCGSNTQLRRLACLRLDDMQEFYI